MKYRPYTPYDKLGMIKQQRMSRAYDLMPILSHQESLNPEQRVYRMVADTAVAVEESLLGGRETVTRYGTMEQKTNQTEYTQVRHGGLDPFDRTDCQFIDKTMVEHADAALQPMKAEEADLVIQELGLKKELPSKFKGLDVTDGATEIAYELTNSGNRSTATQKRTGLNVFNPYEYVKETFKKEGIDTTIIENRLRGYLVTNGVMLDNGNTHIELQEAGILGDILKEVHMGSFGREVGTPQLLSEKYGGRVYELENIDAIMLG